MPVTDEERKTLQQVHEQKVREWQAAREEVTHGVISELVNRSHVSVPTALGEVLKRTQHLYASQQNWGEERIPAATDVVIECRKCGDAGWVRLTRRDGSGETVLCPDCGQERRRARQDAVRRERLAQRLVEFWARVYAEEQDRLWALARSKFDADYIERYSDADIPPATKQEIRAKLDLALRAARRFSEAWPAGILLTFDGAYGAGKTHLLAKIWARAQQCGKSAIYITGSELEHAMTNFTGPSANQEREAMRQDLLDVDVLVVDEVDRMTFRDGNGWAERNLFAIVDGRLMAGRSTVLAGNGFDRLPGAIRSRAKSAGSLFVDLAGVPDARPVLGEGDTSWQA